MCFGGLVVVVARCDGDGDVRYLGGFSGFFIPSHLFSSLTRCGLSSLVNSSSFFFLSYVPSKPFISPFFIFPFIHSFFHSFLYI